MITPPTEQEIREFQSGPKYARMEVVRYLTAENVRLTQTLKTLTDRDQLMRTQGAVQVLDVILWALQSTPSDG